MFKSIKRAGIIAAFAAGAMTLATSAEARDRYYGHHGGNDAAVAIGAGVVGLALGAAIASSGRNRNYDDGYYYGRPRYRAYPRGYYRGYPRGYRYERGGYGWDRGYRGDPGRYGGWDRGGRGGWGPGAYHGGYGGAYRGGYGGGAYRGGWGY